MTPRAPARWGRSTPALDERGDLEGVGDAAVDGDDQIRMAVQDAVDRASREAVPFPEAVRHERRRARSKGAKTAGSHSRGGDTIEVEVAEYHDATPASHVISDHVRGEWHPRDDLGVVPVAPEVRLQEPPDRVGRVMPSRDQHARGQLGESGLLGDLVDEIARSG